MCRATLSSPAAAYRTKLTKHCMDMYLGEDGVPSAESKEAVDQVFYSASSVSFNGAHATLGPDGRDFHLQRWLTSTIASKSEPLVFLSAPELY